MKLKYIGIARKVSKKSTYKIQVGSCIIKGNRILGLGCNSTKTHPKATTRANKIHAEHQALIDAGINELEGSVAFVYRETKDGKAANSKPCASCEALLREAGIKKVYYSLDTFPFWGVDEYV